MPYVVERQPVSRLASATDSTADHDVLAVDGMPDDDVASYDFALYAVDRLVEACPSCRLTVVRRISEKGGSLSISASCSTDGFPQELIVLKSLETFTHSTSLDALDDVQHTKQTLRAVEGKGGSS